MLLVMWHKMSLMLERQWLRWDHVSQHGFDDTAPHFLLHLPS